MYVELRALYHAAAVQEKVWIEIFVIERYRLERLDSSSQPGPVPLVVSHVQWPQAVVADAGENPLEQSYTEVIY